MIISLFAGAKDPSPKRWEGTWEEFSSTFGPHTLSEDLKTQQKAFSPAEYLKTSRGNKGVLQLHLFVLDVDKVSEDQAMKLLDQLDEGGWAFIAYSTWSHALQVEKDGLWRFRVVMPLSEPVPAQKWGQFWASANTLFRGMCDPQCKDPSRLYFGPSVPAEHPEPRFYHVQEGVPLDVEAVFEIPAVVEDMHVPVAQTDLPFDRFRSYAARLSRKRGDLEAELGERLKKVCAGEVFAEPGERDTTIFRLASLLGKRFLSYKPHSIAKHFASSLSLMSQQAEDCPSVEDVAYKIGRRQQAVQLEKAQKEQEEQQASSGRIRDALGPDRLHPYTAEEIAEMGPDLERRWILLHQNGYYFRVGNSYEGPFSKEAAGFAALQYLSPAVSADVELYFYNDKGAAARRPLSSLMEAHGTVVKDVVLDVTKQNTEYNPESGIIEKACCPKRNIKPKFNKAVDKWLRLLAGDKYHQLASWIAALPDLSRPCVALFLTGKKGVGKSFFAICASRIWVLTGPTSLEEVFSNFNGSIAHCPLTFADEQLPKDFRGYSKTGELRHHIQATVRTVNTKFQPVHKLLGATRTIVAANNDSVLATGENLTADDLSAIAERYLHIECGAAAAPYLSSKDTERWLSADTVTAHFLWLAENYEWEPEGRFLIRDPDEESLFRSLAFRSGSRSAVAEWLVNYLNNPAIFDNDARSEMLVRIHKGRLLANAKGISNCWELYHRHERCPTTGKLLQDLLTLSTDKENRVQLRVGKKKINYYEIDIRNLIEWDLRAGLMTKEGIEEALKTSTEDRKRLTEKSVPSKES